MDRKKAQQRATRVSSSEGQRPRRPGLDGLSVGRMTHVIRENAGGNYCGHNPLSPILDLVVPVGTGKGGVPAILGKLSARLDQYYWNPKKVLPSLNFANGSTRKQRTERREACVRLLRAIVGYTDLTSLRVGVPTKDGFVSLTMTVLAKRAGLTPSRADRAMRDLKAANLLTVSQPRQLQPDGSWKGLAAVKAVSRQLFAVFGLDAWLRLEQGKATKRLRKRVQLWSEQDGKPRTLADAARLKLLLGGRSGAPRRGPQQRKSQEARSEEYMRAFNEVCTDLWDRHPGWPPDRIRVEAENILNALRGRLKA